MAQDSTIEWTDHTFNPWIGCTKVSAGCTNCYAETRDKRHLIEPVDHWGKGAPRLRTSAANWRKPLQWNRCVVYECPSCGQLHFIESGKDSDGWECLCSEGGTICRGPRRPRVFCASLADVFDDEVPIEWTADLFALIHRCQNLDWQLLTKRPENWRPRLERCLSESKERRIGITLDDWNWIAAWCDGTPPANVQIGVSVENQPAADERIPQVLQIPAALRFLSCEPLLGPVDLHFAFERDRSNTAIQEYKRRSITSQLHWVIAGGESGPNARPMHPDWARSLRDQCQAAGVPFFFKQWGEFAPVCAQYPRNKAEQEETERAGCRGDIALEPDGAIAEGYQHSAGTWLMDRVGKKRAGRQLDGREWSEFPAPAKPIIGRMRPMCPISLP